MAFTVEKCRRPPPRSPHRLRPPCASHNRADGVGQDQVRVTVDKPRQDHLARGIYPARVAPQATFRLARGTRVYYHAITMSTAAILDNAQIPHRGAVPWSWVTAQRQ